MNDTHLIEAAHRAWNTWPVGVPRVVFDYNGAKYVSEMTDFKIVVMRGGLVVAAGWLS